MILNITEILFIQIKFVIRWNTKCNLNYRYIYRDEIAKSHINQIDNYLTMFRDIAFKIESKFNISKHK